MANYYTRFSAVLDKLNKNEAGWIRNRLHELESTEDGLGFSWALENNEMDPKKDPTSLWIHAGESGDVDQVASFIQSFLKQFRPRSKWGMEWSNDCDKERLDAFGGGAFVATAHTVEWINTGQWLHNKLNPPKRKK
jgi:hypothetical protein